MTAYYTIKTAFFNRKAATLLMATIPLMAISLLPAASATAATKVTALTLNDIQKMNAKCMEHARKANYDVAIAIYDQGGVLLSFTQADGSSPARGEVARWKGLSSAYYRVATGKTAEWNVPTAPKIATIKGGLPIFSTDGNPLGGIGVSGAPSEFDEECAALATQAVAGLRN